MARKILFCVIGVPALAFGRDGSLSDGIMVMNADLFSNQLALQCAKRLIALVDVGST
jgi:hypothetical protein